MEFTLKTIRWLQCNDLMLGSRNPETQAIRRTYQPRNTENTLFYDPGNLEMVENKQFQAAGIVEILEDDTF